MLLSHVHAVEIRFVAPGELRYDTVGDWQFKGDTLTITVADPVGTPVTSVALVAIHELVEAILCDAHGVTADVVDAFDQSPARLESEYADEPGLDPTAPYHREHMVADMVERLVAFALGVDWNAHDKAVEGMAAAVTDALATK